MSGARRPRCPRRRAAWRGLLLVLGSGVASAQETLLQEVSVVAGDDSQEVRRNASTGKLVVGREELEALDAGSIGELLGKLPGTGLGADPDSRRGKGKGADRHLPQILVDGQPLPGGERNPGTALRLPVELIERIEIVRNGTAEFPVAGPGGVINLVLRDVPPRPLRSGRLALGGNDGNNVLRAEGQVGERSEQFGWLLSGAIGSRPSSGVRHSELQRLAAGERSEWQHETATQAGREDSISLAPRLNWNLGGGHSLTLSPLFSHSDDRHAARIERAAWSDPRQGGVLEDCGHDDERTSQRRSSGRLSAEWKLLQPGSGEFSARLALQGERERQEKELLRHDAAGRTLETDAGTRSEREHGLDLRGKRLFGDAHLVTAGAEWRTKRSDESRARTSAGQPLPAGADSAARIDDNRLAVWLQDEWQLAAQHLLTPGLRWERRHGGVTDGTGARIEQRHVALDPSLHYLWQPDPAWNLRASVALADKAPNPKHLSPVLRPASGSNSPANPDRAGNPALAPEQSRSIELGVEHFLPQRAGTIGVSVFHRRIGQHIQKLTQREQERWVERPWNVGDATLSGGLFDFRLRADAFGWPALTLRGNAAYTDTRLSNRVAGLGAGEGPRKSINLGADYELAALRLTLGGNYQWTSALDRESSATVRQTQGARRQLDLYAVHRIDRQFRLRFSAQNINAAARDELLEEIDADGLPVRLEHDRQSTRPTFLVALEGKW